MGDTWMPDRALTIDKILAAQAILEDDWNTHQAQPDLLQDTALTGAMLVSGFEAGLLGEEIPQIDVGGRTSKALGRGRATPSALWF